MSDTPSVRRSRKHCTICNALMDIGARCGPCHAATTAYYHSPEWARLRAQCLERDYQRCVICTSTDRKTAHHIIPRMHGGPDKLSNLVTLCHRCHGEVERGDSEALSSLRRHQQARAHLSGPLFF